jgi:membrane protein YdbS with pleckstrin-like domain
MGTNVRPSRRGASRPAHGSSNPQEASVRIGSIGGLVVIIWLLIGAVAAGQRGYFSSSNDNCAKAGTTVVTVLAGPLNYLGVNPKVNCAVPQPSK